MAIRIKPVFSSTGTAGRVAVFDPSTGLLVASVVTTTELELLSGITGGDILTEDNVKTVSGKTFNQDIVADATNEHDIGSSSVRWKDAYLAGDLTANDGTFSGDVTISGNLYVQGTGTEVITEELLVEDPTITVNDGGDDTTSEGAGLVVERASTNAQLIHANASATKFRAGPAGSEVDLVGTSSTQALTNKTIVAASNTITTAASGNLTSTELNASLAELQGDVDTRQPLDSTLTALAAFNSDGILTQTAADTFVARSIESSDSSITITNEDGVAGNPDLVVNPANVDHNELANLATGDVHTQYVLLAGRLGGQEIHGGTGSSNNLFLAGTSHVGDGGKVYVGSNSGSASGTAVVDGSGRVAIKTTAGATANSDTILEMGELNDELAMRLPRNNDAAESGITGVSGHIYYNDTVGAPKWHDGSNWHEVAPAADVDANTSAIAALDTRLDTAESDISALEGRLDTAEADIDAVESDLATHISDTSTHGVSGAIVGTTDTQALTNKDIDGGTASDTNRITVPKNTKSNLDGLTRKEGTVVYATDTQKAYVDDGSDLIPIGSGSGGGGGINLVTLDSSFTAGANPNNFDFEDANDGVGSWAVYADSAATAPVDMTGGSPGTTIARITSGELNGAASAQVDLGSGSSRQGEGWYTPAYIPPAYRGRTLTCLMPYNISGSIVEDDLVPYCYDVTNSTLIKPYVKDKLLGASGVAHFTFPVSTTTAEVRVGVHIARSSTAALAITFDDVQLSPFSTPVGLAGSDTTNAHTGIAIEATTTAPSGYNVTTNVTKIAQHGDKAIITYFFESTGGGSAGSGTYLFKLPNNLVIDTAKQPVSTGVAAVVGPAAVDGGSNMDGFVVAYDSTHFTIYVGDSGTSASPVSSAFNSFGGGARKFSFTAIVPIVGWSANVSLAESSTFWISSYLANGTRVTSTPSRLGEYRSYSKGASAYTYSDAAPTTAPSATNGMTLSAVNYTSSGGANGNNRYEIFIGRNKNFKLAAYSATAKSGQLDFRHYFVSSTTEAGISHSYDSTTGIVTVDVGATDSSVTTRFIGNVLTPAGAALSQPTTGYFDIQVSENALAVGTQAPRSEVYVSTGNGFGSTNTKIRRFTTISKNIGQAIAYADSATLGASFTINEDGVYSVSYTDYLSSGGHDVGISVNATALTTNIAGLNYAQGFRGYVHTGIGDEVICFSRTYQLSAGDVVRPHTNGVQNGTDEVIGSFSIVKVSN